MHDRIFRMTRLSECSKIFFSFHFIYLFIYLGWEVGEGVTGETAPSHHKWGGGGGGGASAPLLCPKSVKYSQLSNHV